MGKNVLIVDDCATTRKIISLYLKSGGYNPIQASNGVEAVEKLIRTEVDFIITDLNMPQMDGFELTRWVNSSKDFRDTPLIILTSDQDCINKKTSLEGITTVMSKPLSRDSLLKELEKIVVRRER